nr:retrovirus-related Pol polyprotein from transposon TNT 1-94 [Tanacetum cinerariifolium]
ATRNKEKAIVNSPQPIYDQEPSMVAEDDEMSKDKEIDKLMALISLSFKKIYKPTNNNLLTSSNTSKANQDNSPRINRGTGYKNQRIGDVAGARETVARECQKPKSAKDAAYHRETMLLCKQEEAGVQLNAEQDDLRDDIDDELEDQELEAHYMYMAKIQEVSPDAADFRPIFDAEPLQKVSNDDHYNVFAIESEHPEKSNLKQIDQNDDYNDLANERKLLAYLIKKLKCEIDDSKNRNKFLETSNKVLIEKLKGEIEDFKIKNKTLESSNNRFKEAKNKLSETNKLLYNDFKKSQAELERRNEVEYASKINNLNQTILEMKKKLSAHQETISILSQQKEAQIKLYKTREDKELDKVIALENKVKVLDDIVYKTGQSVQTMNMLNNKCRTSFAKLEFLKKAQRANPRLYDIGLNHNLFYVGQFCDADLEVAFRKSTCYIRDLKGNDILTGSRGTDLYSITLQDTNSPNPICLMAKATSSQAWLWHRRLSHLNFDTIDLLSKNDIVDGLPKLKFVKDHLYSSYETPEVLIDFLRLVQKGLHAQEGRGSKQGVYVLYSEALEDKEDLPQPGELQQCPSGYKWVPKTKIQWVPKAMNENVEKRIVQLILFIVDSGCTKHMTGNLKLLCNFVKKYLGTVRFGNDQFSPILGYGDLVQGNIRINRVYYVEGLNHNLFSVGQFCDANLEVAFLKSTCFVRDLQDNDLLIGNRGSDLYTISLQESTSLTPLCLMAKALPTQAWLQRQRLSQLNFDYINLLSKKDVVIGLPKLKYVKDQLCSYCEVSKAKRSSFKSMAVPNAHAPSQQELDLLFGLLYDEFFTAEPSTPTYVHAEENNNNQAEEEHLLEDEFTNPLWTLNCTTMSSAKAEYVALSASYAQVIHSNLMGPRTALPYQAHPYSVSLHKGTVLRYDGDECDKGRMPTKIELTLEQSQQGVGNDILIVQLILFIVDSGCTKHMTGNLKLLCNFVEKYLGTVRFGNDQFAPILGYGDLVQVNITINKVYYVEGLNHNLFSVGQFCDADLEVAFRKSTCFVRDLQDNDLLIDKIKEKGDPSILVGYSTQSKGYRVYNKRTRLIVESIHIRFDEIKEMSETSVANDTSRLIPQRQKASDYDNSGPPVQARQKLATDLEMCMFTLTVSTAELKNIKEAMADSTWIVVMQEELHQFDRLQEVYVAQPDRFVDPDHPKKVYRLRKALYGLKQAPRVWYDELSKFLTSKGFTKGLQIHQSPSGIFINQDKYALEILHKHGMEKGQSIGTPMATKPKLDADLSGNPVDQTGYRSKIGSLMYLTSSRPDIVQAMLITPDSLILSGGIQFLGDKLVRWTSKKHDCTTMSSVEAENVALSASCAQVMWMRTQLQDYGLNYNNIPLYCDSQSAIAISCNPVQHSRTKHIHTRYQFIKEQVENDTIMSDSKDSTATYTEVSSPFEGLSDIGSLRVEGPPMMPEDPYAYVVAAFQAPPSPNYVPRLKEPKQAPPLPEFVPEPVYPKFMPLEDEILPAEEQPLPAADTPTVDSPGYILESNLGEDLEEDDEDLKEDPVDSPPTGMMMRRMRMRSPSNP